MLYIDFSTQISTAVPISKKAIRNWNQQLFDAFAKRLEPRPSKTDRITVAGPPACEAQPSFREDRPWWWGKIDEPDSVLNRRKKELATDVSRTESTPDVTCSASY